MIQYAYRAKSGPQDIVHGVIEADSAEAAVAGIIKSGQTPLEVKPHQDQSTLSLKVEGGLSLGRLAWLKLKETTKIPLNALGVFTRQMYDLLDAGIPLLRSLELLSHQKTHPLLKSVIVQMIHDIQEGSSLSSAMSQHRHIFSGLYINMVKSGETSGHLPEILDRLAQFIEKEEQIRARVKSAMLYPMIILGVGILTIFVMLTFVLPRLTILFEDFGADLPWQTKTVLAISSFFAQFWWLLLIAAVGSFLWLRNFFYSAQGRQWLDERVLSVTLLGDFIRRAEMARFARTLGTLLESGVAIPLALESSAAVVENSILRRQTQKIAELVRSGSSLTQALKGNAIFPEVAVNLISVGEESGKLERGLYKFALLCERETSQLSETFVTILGPLMLVVIVGVVGFMVVAMLLPMFKMNMIVN